MKVVLDTNIFISGIISPNSNAGKLIKEWQNNSLEIITSFELLEEIKQVLKYPKIIKKVGWDDKKIEEFVEYLHFFTTVVDISDISYHFEQDPNDNHIIATYLAAKCDYLITGDKALFSLKNKLNVVTLECFVNEYYLLPYS